MDFNTWDKLTMLKFSRENPHSLRIGQFYSNQLAVDNLYLYRKLPSDIDPYYYSIRFPSFIEWLRENWELI